MKIPQKVKNLYFFRNCQCLKLNKKQVCDFHFSVKRYWDLIIDELRNWFCSLSVKWIHWIWLQWGCMTRLMTWRSREIITWRRPGTNSPLLKRGRGCWNKSRKITRKLPAWKDSELSPFNMLHVNFLFPKLFE